jgi:AraC-like DNA-binding protein
LRPLLKTEAETEAYGFSYTSGPQAPVQRLHRHDEIELCLAEHGNVWALIGSTRTVLHPAQLVVFWATQPHGPVRVDPGTRAHSIHVPLPFLLNNSEIPAPLIRALLNGEVIISTAESDNDISDLVLIKHWVKMLANESQVSRRVVLLEVTARLLRLASQDTASRTRIARMKSSLLDATSGIRRMHFLRIARLIAERCGEPWSIASIAAEVGLNPSYAMRLFRDIGGITITDCLSQQRVARAQRLLLTTDKKIIDIAFESGFNSLSAFYDVFLRFCGRAPAEYRKSFLE